MFGGRGNHIMTRQRESNAFAASTVGTVIHEDGIKLINSACGKSIYIFDVARGLSRAVFKSQPIKSNDLYIAGEINGIRGP